MGSLPGSLAENAFGSAVASRLNTRGKNNCESAASATVAAFITFVDPYVCIANKAHLILENQSFQPSSDASLAFSTGFHCYYHYYCFRLLIIIIIIMEK